MSIKRGYMKFDHDFTIIPNAWARDERLSRKARGLLLELASHRPGWEITLPNLVRHGPEGIDSVRAGISELKDAGYLKVERVHGPQGRLQGTDYILQDPFAEVAVSPTSEKPTQGKPTQANPTPKKTILEEENLEEEQGLFEAPATVAKVKKVSTSVPEQISISAEMKEWALGNAPSVVHSLERETASFLDWHRSRGRKYLDWTAAWRNWMRKAHEFNMRTAGGVAHAPQAQPAHNGRRLNINYDEPDTGDATGYSTSTR